MRPRRSPILALLLLGNCCLAGPALAEQRPVSIAGSSLQLADLCARHVFLTVDPALQDRVEGTISADHVEEIERLSFSGGGGVAKVRPRDPAAACWPARPSGPFTPTLDIALRIPRAMPLSVSESGMSRYDIGGVGPLSIEMSGFGTFRIGSATGPVSMDLSGHADVTLASIDADRLRIGLSGDGRVAVPQGRIEQMVLDQSGVGTVQIGATVSDATLALSGAGSAQLDKVTGPVRKDLSGMTTLTVNGQRSGGFHDD